MIALALADDMKAQRDEAHAKVALLETKLGDAQAALTAAQAATAALPLQPALQPAHNTSAWDRMAEAQDAVREAILASNVDTIEALQSALEKHSGWLEVHGPIVKQAYARIDELREMRRALDAVVCLRRDLDKAVAKRDLYMRDLKALETVLEANQTELAATQSELESIKAELASVRAELAAEKAKAAEKAAERTAPPSAWDTAAPVLAQCLRAAAPAAAECIWPRAPVAATAGPSAAARLAELLRQENHHGAARALLAATASPWTATSSAAAVPLRCVAALAEPTPEPAVAAAAGTAGNDDDLYA